MTSKQGQPDTQGSKICGFVLDGSQHNDRESQLARRKHLNEEATNDGGAAAQADANGQGARQ
jgi:hypothetical protein